MKIAIFGGSFNPIHLSHIEIAKSVLEFYDKVVFIPAYISPFKTEDISRFEASPLDRLNMVHLAVKDEPSFEVEPFEILKEKPSFTIDTVKYIYKKHPKIDGKLGLIMGSDSLNNITKWKDYDELENLCTFIVAKRENEKIEKTSFSYKLLDKPIKPISSTMIREKIKKNEEWGSLVSSPVGYYIRKNGLYTLNLENIEVLIKEISSYAKTFLSEKRFLHVVGAAEMAEKLARSYPNLLVFPRLAYLAGIAHDITKEESDFWQEKTIKQAGEILDEIEKTNLRIAHGKTASIVLQKQFGIRNKSLLDAIRYHTFTHPNLDNLGKILYIADKIEMGRKGVENIRQMIGTSNINEIMCILLENGKNSLSKKGLAPHPFAVELLKKLKTTIPSLNEED